MVRPSWSRTAVAITEDTIPGNTLARGNDRMANRKNPPAGICQPVT